MSERDDQLLQQIRDVETQCTSVLTELRQFEQAVNNVRAQDLANIPSMVNSIAQSRQVFPRTVMHFFR